MPTGSTSRDEESVLLFLYLSPGYTGRKTLSRELGIGEGRVRGILRRLAARGLLETVRSGSRLTVEGRRRVEALLAGYGGRAAAVLDCGEAEPGALCAALHCRGPDVWGRALELRDCAVRGGAAGALIIVAGADGLILPPGGERVSDYLPRLEGDLWERFEIIGGDSILAPFSGSLGPAVRGLVSMLGCLVGPP